MRAGGSGSQGRRDVSEVIRVLRRPDLGTAIEKEAPFQRCRREVLANFVHTSRLPVILPAT